MANMYNWWPNFKSVDELKSYVDWVAKENNIDHETAMSAIVDANQITIQWRKIADWDPVDEKVWQDIIPELKPVVWEAWYEEPKSAWEKIWWALVQWIKDELDPKKYVWRKLTNWYFDWETFNTNKLVKDAKSGKNKKAEDKKVDTKEEWNNAWASKEDSKWWLLKFGKDATSMQQIETRDKQLAKILNEKWVTDIAKVEEFLNHFDTFKEASDENKRRTISRIYWNIKDLNKWSDSKSSEGKEEKPQWIYIDQEDYKWTPDAKEWLDMYNKYAQAEAEKWDSTKVFRDMMKEAPTSSNTTPVRNKLKDAGLSTAQINDFTQAWADAYYQADGGPINDVKFTKPSSLWSVKLKKSKK